MERTEDQFISQYLLGGELPQRHGGRLSSAAITEIAEALRRELEALGLPLLEPEANQRLQGQRHPRTNEMLRVYALGLRAFPDIAAATGHDPDAVERLALADQVLGGLIRGLEVNFEEADLGCLECVELAHDHLRVAQGLADELRSLGAPEEDVIATTFSSSLLVQALKGAQERATAVAPKLAALEAAETEHKEQLSDTEVKQAVQEFLKGIVEAQAPAAAAAPAHSFDKVRRRPA